MKTSKPENPNTYALEVVCELYLALLLREVALHTRVGVVYDREEHVQQDEEHEEDVGDEEGRPEERVRRSHSREVEVAQHDPEQCEAIHTYYVLNYVMLLEIWKLDYISKPKRH